MPDHNQYNTHPLPPNFLEEKYMVDKKKEHKTIPPREWAGHHAVEFVGIEDLLRGMGGCPEEVGFGPTNRPGQYGLQITVGPVRVQFVGDRENWLNLGNGIVSGINGYEARTQGDKPPKDPPPDMDETVA